jgi:hypothetical protein
MKLAIASLSKRRNFQAAAEKVMRAIQTQRQRDIAPNWGFFATL